MHLLDRWRTFERKALAAILLTAGLLACSSRSPSYSLQADSSLLTRRVPRAHARATHVGLKMRIGPTAGRTRQLAAGSANSAAGAGVLEPAVLLSGDIYIGASEVHGLGIFANRDFAEGDLLHEAPGLLLRRPGSFEEPALQDYVFCGPGNSTSVVGFGCASLFNHNDEPSAGYEWKEIEPQSGRMLAQFYALRPIKQDEEIFTSYGEDWFKDRDGRVSMFEQLRHIRSAELQLSLLSLGTAAILVARDPTSSWTWLVFAIALGRCILEVWFIPTL